MRTAAKPLHGGLPVLPTPFSEDVVAIVSEVFQPVAWEMGSEIKAEVDRRFARLQASI